MMGQRRRRGSVLVGFVVGIDCPAVDVRGLDGIELVGRGWVEFCRVDPASVPLGLKRVSAVT